MRNLQFLYNCQSKYAIKIPRSMCCTTSRVICTDTKLRTLSSLKPRQDSVSEHEIGSPFLKENFNIVDNRYFKLISISKECYLEDILKKEEFKEVVSRSFSFDVNLFYASKTDDVPHPGITVRTLEELCGSSSAQKQSPDIFQCVSWCSSTGSKESESGKPTEQMLLRVIDKLTQSLISFFEKPLDYSVYHKNIVFHNNIRGVSTRGLSAYVQAMYILKLYGLFHYAKVKVEILKITHHIEDGSIRVRWRVNGISRHRMLMTFWKLKSLTWPKYIEEETDWLDGFSVFSVGPDGLIYKHICDKLTPDDEIVKVEKSDLKRKLLGLFDLSPRGPAPGSLHALLSCYRNTMSPNCKRMT